MNIRTAVLLGVALLVSMVGAGAAQQMHSTPDASHGDHVMATPGTTTSMGAFYLTVKNTGDEPDRLVKIESDIADTIEIHDVEMKDGAMTMQLQHDGVEIPAGEELVLEPGSSHVMLIGITRSLVDGEEFTATLHFEKAGEVEITVPIYAAEPGEDENDAEPVKVGDNLEITGIWARHAPKLDGMGTPAATPEN